MIKILSTCLLALAFPAFGVDNLPPVKPIIIAHRGASGYLPEHTLEAKALAYAMGADYLEQDLVLSKEGVPIVLHDIYVDTVTDVASKFPGRKRADGRFYAIDFTVAELKQLNVTERFNPKTGEVVFKNRFPVGKGSFQLSTFEEEIQFIQGLNKSTGRDVGIYPEIKSPAWHRQQGQDLSKVVLPILERYGYRTKADKFYLQCFEFAELKRIRQGFGFQGKIILLQGGNNPEDEFHRTHEGLKSVAEVADGIGPALNSLVTASSNGTYQITGLVTNAHALKLEVHPYTFRADELPKYAKSLDELFRIFFDEVRVDGLFTDFPDQGVSFLKTHKKN